MTPAGRPWVRTHNTRWREDSGDCLAIGYQRTAVESSGRVAIQRTYVFEDPVQTIGGRIRTAKVREAPAVRNENRDILTLSAQPYCASKPPFPSLRPLSETVRSSF